MGLVKGDGERSFRLARMPPCWIIRSPWFKTTGHPVAAIVRHRAIYIIVAESSYSPRIFIVRTTIRFCPRHERAYPNLLPTMPVYPDRPSRDSEQFVPFSATKYQLCSRSIFLFFFALFFFFYRRWNFVTLFKYLWSRFLDQKRVYRAKGWIIFLRYISAIRLNIGFINLLIESRKYRSSKRVIKSTFDVLKVINPDIVPSFFKYRSKLSKKMASLLHFYDYF